MKKSIVIFLVAVLSPSAAANDFQVKVRLGEHRTDNPNGVWTIEKKSANSKQMRSKILPKSEGETYPCLQYARGEGCWDIRIIDVSTFKNAFVGKTYYHFYWRKRKNKGYIDPNGEAINRTISPIPQLILQLKNRSGKKLTLLSLRSRSVFQQGGMADSSEYKVKPKVIKGAMEISHNRSDTMTFSKGYEMPSGKVIDLPLSLWVKNAAYGDGTGDLAYALELHYIEDGKAKREIVVNLLQGDAEGYDKTAGGIAPLN